MTTSRLAVAVLAACALLLGAVPAVAAEGGPQRAPERGALVSVEHLYSRPDAAAVAADLESRGFDGGSARFGVEGYRVVYRTVDAAGRPTVASGLLTVPRERYGPLRAVVYGHGSVLHRADAPSTDPHGFDGTSALAYATAGFVTLTPDYVGMGVGHGGHPYLHVRSGADAALDMLRAADALAPKMDRSLRSEVFVTGFSQGAGVALGLGRELQGVDEVRFRPAALAAVSGGRPSACTWSAGTTSRPTRTPLPAHATSRRREQTCRRSTWSRKWRAPPRTSAPRSPRCPTSSPGSGR